jgi:23S rRNA pseudouridine1911/1915/1917 synthase
MPKAPGLHVLYEDNHLLVVVKPPGIPTQGAPGKTDSLLVRARRYLKRKYHKPGNVYVGVVSRLDSPVSGVVVLARTSKAARRLNEQFRSRSVLKRYWTLVEGRPSPLTGECVDWLRRDAHLRRMEIAEPDTPTAQEARIVYRRLRALSGISLLEVELQTGRKHQIRVQLAVRGWPIVGDQQYGSRRAFPEGIALHARSLTLVHPTRGESMEFVASVPLSWASFGVRETG